jgi:hypothetical protein
MDSTMPAAEPDNRRRNMIIAAVVAALLLCCCCVILPSLYIGWTCGDYFLGGPAGNCIFAP